MTRIALTGALGRMGTLIIQEAAKREGLELVAGLDVVGAGKELPGGILVRDASELDAVLQESNTNPGGFQARTPRGNEPGAPPPGPRQGA